MAKLSPARMSVPVLEGLELLNRGKVRDTYRLPDDRLLVVATDGVSVFDFVLNALIAMKGYVLTAVTHYWLLYLESQGVKTHFVAAGKDIDEFLPEHLRRDSDLQRRAMVVMALTMIHIEFIARFYLTGSVLKEYQTQGTVYGKPMPAGLRDGDELPDLLFTPTTKADEGHDEPVDADGVLRDHSEATALFLRACRICAPVAREKNTLYADTKGEIGVDMSGEFRIGDEWFTPDSSRIWDKLAHEKSRKDPNRKAPSPFDKQYVRDDAIKHGVNKLDPKNPEHVAQVHAIEFSREILEDTTHIYCYVFWRLTGMTIEEYARRELGVDVPDPKMKVVYIFGSRSDIPKMKSAFDAMPESGTSCIEGKPVVHVISCHRNTKTLMDFVERDCDGADVVVAIAGKAAALPGMLDALISQSKRQIPVIGVGVGEPGTKSYEAAKLSIEELPEQPVVIDEMRGSAYMGLQGLEAAILRIAAGEMPPRAKRPHKPAELNIDLSQF